MKKLSLLVFGLVCMFAIATAIPSQKPNQVAKFMQVKRQHAHELLDGLALEDYGRIAKYSEKLSLLSHEASWKVLQTPDYLEHSRSFRKSTNQLAKAAKAKNLDGATLAYFQVTLNCVNCHKYVRTAR